MKQALTLNFKYPENLNDDSDRVISLLKNWHSEIGKEQLEMRLDSILLEWAMKNNYFYSRDNNQIVFTHNNLRGIL